MIRSRDSVPMAENMSAYFAICSADFLDLAVTIFLCLQKDGCSVKNLCFLGGSGLLKLVKHEESSSHEAEKSCEMVPLQTITEVEHAEHAKHAKRNHFLNDFQLIWGKRS